ncbi:AMP-binding enzyme [Natrinema salaciae]|uniref:AMP-binding enzyme n=1 Tax=Natrinema salaciae TaxID=1186196 RepID=UPI000B880BF9|nr:hypothetical protein [Natrinema salaciae]
MGGTVAGTHYCSIALVEVEGVLKTHLDVATAAVAGRDHETKGEAVIAAIVLEQVPVTDMGKLDRDALEDEAAD